MAGVLGVHELRYRIAFGGQADATLAHHGHGYLTALTPLLALLVAVALGQVLVRAAAARPTAPTAGVRVRRLWPASSVALLGVYIGQELLEGLLAPGHPSGWAAVLGGDGWVVVPLALALGALVVLALRGARLAESSSAARIPGCLLTRPLPAVPRRRNTAVVVLRGRVLAEHLAGRGPPVVA